MRKKVVSAILCASMVAGMVVIPGVAVKADDKKLIGVTMPTKIFRDGIRMART